MLWLRHLTLSSLSQCHFPSDHGLGVCTEAICRVRVGPCRARLGSDAGLTGYNQFFSGTQTIYIWLRAPEQMVTEMDIAYREQRRSKEAMDDVVAGGRVQTG